MLIDFFVNPSDHRKTAGGVQPWITSQITTTELPAVVQRVVTKPDSWTLSEGPAKLVKLSNLNYT